MRFSRIADFINRINDRINGGIVTNCKIGSFQIIVYGTR